MKGYQGVGPMRGRFVPDAQALCYALEQTGLLIQDPAAPECAEFCAAFVEWFYSGNFYPIEKEDADDA